MTPQVISIQAGQVQQLGSDTATDLKNKSWSTAFYKQAVMGSVQVLVEGLIGDQQADRINHGGPEKAVLLYSAEHFEAWKHELGMECSGGAFGENLTVTDCDETTVCIGDHWQLGTVILEISQPRQPCWKLARRWDIPMLPKRVVQTGRSGWYARVIREGTIEAGCPLELSERLHPNWTISRASTVYYSKDIEAKQELARLERLSKVWKRELLEKYD